MGGSYFNCLLTEGCLACVQLGDITNEFTVGTGIQGFSHEPKFHFSEINIQKYSIGSCGGDLFSSLKNWQVAFK